MTTVHHSLDATNRCGCSDGYVELTILHSATRQNAAQVLRDAATTYKVDVDAIVQQVKQEFAAKETAKLARKPVAKSVPAKAKKSA